MGEPRTRGLVQTPHLKNAEAHLAAASHQEPKEGHSRRQRFHQNSMRRGQQTPSVFNLNVPPRTHETASTFGNSELFCSEINKLFSGNGSRSFRILIMATASEMRIQQLCGQGTSGMPSPPRCRETDPPPPSICGQLASKSDVTTRLFTIHNSGTPTNCACSPLHQIPGSLFAQYLILCDLTMY